MTQSSQWPREGGSGLAVRTGLNENDKANATCHKGATPPGYAVDAGFVWLDDSADPVWSLRVYIGGVVSNLANWPTVWSINRSTGIFQLPKMIIKNSAEAFRVEGSAPFLAFYDAAGTTRSGYIQRTPTTLAFSADAGDMSFTTASIERAKIDTSGNLLVGTSTGGWNIIKKAFSGNGSGLLSVADSNGDVAVFASSLGPAGNASSSTLNLRATSNNNRSINAGGTINASGADRAEYHTKLPGCGAIVKGQLVGLSRGKITDVFAGATKFRWKSTDPDSVGGDRWGTVDKVGPKPQEPVLVMPPCPMLAEDPSLLEVADYEAALVTWAADCGTAIAAHEAAMADYAVALAAWEAVVETARQQVDRLSYSGRVPAIIAGPVTEGWYVKAQEAADGCIEAVCVETYSDADRHLIVGQVEIANPTTAEFHELINSAIPINLAWTAIVSVG